MAGGRWLMAGLLMGSRRWLSVQSDCNIPATEVSAFQEFRSESCRALLGLDGRGRPSQSEPCQLPTTIGYQRFLLTTED